MGRLDEQYQALTKFTWSTSNEEIASIDPETGELTEVKQAGNVDIIATLWVKSAGKDLGDWAQTGIAARKTVVIKGEPTAPSVDAVSALLDVKVSDTMKMGEGAAHEAKTFENLIENTEGANDSYEIGEIERVEIPARGLSSVAEFLGLTEPTRVWRADVTVENTEGANDSYEIGEIERVEIPARGLSSVAEFLGLTEPTRVWRADVTVHAAPYVAAYDADAKFDEGAHRLAEDQAATAKVTLEWDDEAGSWKLAEAGESPIEFKVTCAKTVTFDAKGGTLEGDARQVTLEWDDEAGSWKLAEAGESPIEFKVTCAKTVTFDAKGGTLEGDARQTVAYGQQVTLPNATLAEHVLRGWNDVEGTTHKAGEKLEVKGDMALTALWETEATPVTATVTFDAGEGQLPIGTPETQQVTLEKLEVKGDMALTALWETEATPVTATVTFDAGEGQLPIGTPETQQVTLGGTIAVLPEPTRDGFEFKGWFNGDRQFEAGKTKVEGPLTLTAKWEPVSIQIAFDAQGGTFANQGEQTRQAAFGSKLGELPQVSREGFTFKWEPVSIQIAFDAQGGTFANQGEQTRQAAFGSKLGELPQVSREGFTFLGWFDAKTDGAEVTADTVVDFTAPKTFYAHWEAKSAPDLSITVTFNAGEGHFGEDKAAQTAQRTFTKPATLHTSDVPAVSRAAPDLSITVTFNAGEGHFGEDKAAQTAQRTFTKPATLHTSDVPAVSRDGYTLEGWYASAGFEEGTRVVFADEARGPGRARRNCDHPQWGRRAACALATQQWGAGERPHRREAAGLLL